MKKSTWAATLILLGLGFFLCWGCSQEKSPGTPPPNVEDDVGAIQIVLERDTITFLPGDSASAEVTIYVRNKQGNVMTGIQVDLALANPNLGFLEFVDQSKRDTTDGLGRVNLVYRSFGQPGDNIITAQVGSMADTANIVVRQAREAVSTLSISASRIRLEVPQTLEDSVAITVRIADSDGQGIENVSLRLRSPQGGRFAPLPPTNNNGSTQTVWYSNAQYGVFTVSVRAGGLVDSVQVTVVPIVGTVGTLRLSTNTNFIRADDCRTKARIRATLKDPYGVAVAGDTIWFGAPGLGKIVARAVTDSFGVATTDFCEDGVPTETDSAVVVARYLPWGINDTLRFWIGPAAEIGQVVLTTNREEGVAGIDSAALSVTVRYTDGSAVEGRYVHFIKTCGNLAYDSLELQFGSTSTNFWRFCDIITDTTLGRAVVYAEIDGVADSARFWVNPGPARQVRVWASQNVIQINERVLIYALVADSFGNHVREQVPVMFETSFGTLSPRSPVPTNPSGIAVVELHPGTTSGQAVVKGSVASGAASDSTVISVLSGYASTILFTVSNPTPQVRGTGGQDWTQLQARVYDANGNPVPDGLWVTFEILHDPPGGGANINNRGRLDSAQTASGLAVATFNSGIRAGPVELEARCYVMIIDTVEPDTTWQRIAVRASNISIVSGPPATMDIQPSEIGIDVDGAAWDVVVTALVRDSYNNPVRDGIAVFFEVEPDTAMVMSDTVTTGNGSHVPGVAFTRLRYLSSATNQLVFLTGSTAGDPPVTETVQYVLPAQDPTIALYCRPATWHFDEQGDPARIECRAVVEDAHGLAINGCMVNYTTDRARFYTTENGNTELEYTWTGVNDDDEAGVAVLWLRAFAEYAFPTPTSTEINCNVQVEIDGYEEAIDSQIITFRRLGP